MSGAFSIVEIPLLDRSGVVEICDPGIVRHVLFGVGDSPLVTLPGVRSTRQQEHLLLWVEVDPTKPKRRRTFVVLGPGLEFLPNPGVHASYVGTAVSPNTSAVAIVYEVHDIVDVASIDVTAKPAGLTGEAALLALSDFTTTD